MDAVSVATTSLPPLIDNGRMSVRLEDGYFKQMRLLRPNNDNIVNIYIVYLIDPRSNSRNTDYTVQNALFGGVKITKNATDTSKHKYEDCMYTYSQMHHTYKYSQHNPIIWPVWLNG